MNETTIKEDWEVLTSFFPEDWEKKAYETGALVRRRKIDSPETLLRVLLIHLADGKSLRTTVAYAREANLCQINDAALLHRLRASGQWLRWMAVSLRGSIDTIAAVRRFARKNRVRLIDASMVSEPGSTGSDWRLHYSLNLESLHCDAFEVTDYHAGESFTRFSVWPQDLLVGDRAYCNRKGILHVVNQGADVLVRFHSTALPLFNYRSQRMEVLTNLRTLKGAAVGDWNVYLFKDSGEKVKGRLCAIRKSQEAIEKAKKAILQAASKKQRKVKPETLEYAEYVVLFTTVNRHRLKKIDVMELYRARWQVELAFKRLKGIMDLGHLPKSDPESCKAWLYGKLFVALLVEHIYQEAESFSPWGYPLRAVKA
jgi:hypothetical protein